MEFKIDTIPIQASSRKLNMNTDRSFKNFGFISQWLEEIRVEFNDGNWKIEYKKDMQCLHGQDIEAMMLDALIMEMNVSGSY